MTGAAFPTLLGMPANAGPQFWLKLPVDESTAAFGTERDVDDILGVGVGRVPQLRCWTPYMPLPSANESVSRLEFSVQFSAVLHVSPVFRFLTVVVEAMPPVSDLCFSTERVVTAQIVSD
jgi:hypothetical protein